MSSAISRSRSLWRTVATFVATIALIGSGAVAATAAPEETPLASLSGVVTDAATGGGIGGASVVVLDAEGAEAGSARTGSSGGYTVAELEPGEYRVSVSADASHEPAFWPAASSWADAGAVALVSGEVRVGVDVALKAAAGVESETEGGESETRVRGAEDEEEVVSPAKTASEEVLLGERGVTLFSEDGTGAISGVVTRASDGSPVEGWRVEAYAENAIWHDGFADTLADGSYVIDGLAPGRYLIGFVGSDDWRTATDLAPEFWPGGSPYSRDGEWIEVSADETVTDIDASLDAGATITGTVTRADGGAPLEGIEVYLAYIWSYDDFQIGRSTHTKADGSYVLTGVPAGEHLVYFSPEWESGLIGEYWENTRYAWNATPVNAESGATVSGIDASLVQGGAITGVVTREDTGEPAEGAWVTVSGDGGFYSAHVEADGSYAIDHVVPGDYEVYFSPDGESELIGEYWEGAHEWSDRTLITVTGGIVTAGIDAALAVAGSISGVVTRSDNGEPVAEISVIADGGGAGWGSSVTEEDGSFTISGLAPGAYVVEFSTWSEPELLREYWDGAYTRTGATPVEVQKGQDTPGIDASLEKGGSISGEILYNGLPWSAVGTSDYVSIYVTDLDAERRDYWSNWIDTQDSHYTFEGLPPGDYLVEARPARAPLASQFYRDGAGHADGAAVRVTFGADTPGIDFDLSDGVNISGNLDVVSGSPTTAPQAVAYRWNDGSWDEVRRITAWGNYSFSGASENVSAWSGYNNSYLPAGTYKVGFEIEGYCAQFWESASSLDAATSFTPAIGTTRTGIDAALTPLAEGCDDATGPGSVVAGDIGGSLGFDGDGLLAFSANTDAAEWAPAPVALSYQWFLGGEPVAGAQSASFTLAETLSASALVSVEVTGARAGYESTTVRTDVGTGSTFAISGDPVVGSTLSAGSSGATYRWFADDVLLADALGNELVIGEELLGKTLRASKIGSTSDSPIEFGTSAAFGPIQAAPLPNISAGTPSITGTPTAGEVLTAVPGTWDPADATLSYQWSADGSVIAGATGSTFVAGDDEVGKTLTVTVTGSKEGYQSASATSAPSGPIQAAPLLDLEPGTPTISGTPQVGETLTAAPGTWGPAPVTLSYQWLADGEPVEGATGATFTPAGEHAGTAISVTVRGTKAGHNPASVTSAATGPVAEGDLSTATPVIEGTPRVGEPLTVTPGAWGPGEVDLGYQWFVGDQPVDGASERSFTPGPDHLGAPIAVTVTGTKPGYASASETSAATAPVAEGILSVGQPVVTGTPRVGEELTVQTPGWGPQPIELSYEWLSDGEPIEGATGAVFAPTAEQVGTELSARVSAAKPGYAPEERTVELGVVPPSLTLSTSRAQVGEVVHVVGEFFGAGEEIVLELHSTPIPLTTVIADSEGRFQASFTVPKADLGAHAVVATGAESGLVGTAPLEVYDPAVVPPTEGNGDDGHPATGAELPIAAATLGVLLLLGGALLLIRRRRRVTS